MTDLKTFNIVNISALTGGVTLASVEMILHGEIKKRKNK